MSIIEYIKERGGYVRAMDVESRAMYKQLLSEVTKGNVVRIRNGIYALPEDMAKTMVDVESIVLGGVLCLPGDRYVAGNTCQRDSNFAL